MIILSAYFGPLSFEHIFQSPKPYECSMGKVSECSVEVVERLSGEMTRQSSAMGTGALENQLAWELKQVCHEKQECLSSCNLENSSAGELPGDGLLSSQKH